MIGIFKTIVFIIFLPPVLFKDIFQSDRSIIRKILYFILVALIFGTIWWSGYDSLKFLFTYNLYEMGITDKLTKVKTSGPSMMPTIPDGSEITLNSPKKFGLSRGDIVSFENIETGGLHYLKRIVGLSGEEVSIKNGFVTINDKILQEDYTLNNLPTFGNTFMVDCESYTVPKDHYMVLGDNRTVSWDSRAIGFVEEKNIDGVMKTNIAEKFVPDDAQTKLLKKEIDPGEFLQKINEFREKNKSLPLVTYPKLNDLAKKRVEQIGDNFDTWKKDTTSVETLMQEAQYRYNMVHEYVTFGYLDAQDALGQISESPLEKDVFLSPNYTEVGVGVSERTVGTCTFPIISIILTWPVSLNYDPKIIEFWQNEVVVTGRTINTLQTYVGAPGYNQSELRNFITLTSEQSEIASRILRKLEASEWLDEKDNQDIERYTKLVKDSETLGNQFFQR